MRDYTVVVVSPYPVCLEPRSVQAKIARQEVSFRFPNGIELEDHLRQRMCRLMNLRGLRETCCQRLGEHMRILRPRLRYSPGCQTVAQAV